ncbi:MAG: glycosyltransferase family 4 protein [Bradyrhizobiaceae bacterium]|nr:glycosyltransferase family 4 protein [Bradyrhizobiaceae bacterium]
MRILLSSYVFYPSIGGLQTAGLFLASGLAERGHQVTVVTTTPGDGREFPFTVVRQPTASTLFRLVREADIVWQNQISLRSLWPLLLVSQPLVFMHHISLRKIGDHTPHLGWLKRVVCRTGYNVFVSKELREDAGLPGRIVPNSYDARIFRVLRHFRRDRDIAFVGRFERFKGADLLIDAVAQLAAQGMEARATVIGFGPEEAALKAQATTEGIGPLVDFPGALEGEALVQMLNRHRILVVPSRCDEAFGLVALEALACGCVVVAADSGALPEVIGSCGYIFPKEDSKALAGILRELLAHPGEIEKLQQHIPAQLAKFDRTAILDSYEAVLREVVRA